MPIYEFECAHCGHRFDRLQKLSDPDPEICPSCGAPQVQRRLSAPSFRLAGSGWYETDFKKDGDKKRNLVDGSGTGESDSKAAEAPAPAPSPAPAPASTPAPAPAPAAKPSGESS
ncbi:zinc ribbon domain-containing protein [Dyella sp. A6]|uniref:FmdB family zinc ribbon protein n=1 Tax=Dyella aluminiiresistens TaxID=3069105 RepID=UPI002E787657|nr:zinc ribbon domain-containing protein [Dyella sp. A6]